MSTGGEVYILQESMHRQQGENQKNVCSISLTWFSAFIRCFVLNPHCIFHCKCRRKNSKGMDTKKESLSPWEIFKRNCKWKQYFPLQIPLVAETKIWAWNWGSIKLMSLLKYIHCTKRINDITNKQKMYLLKINEFMKKELNCTFLHGWEPEFEQEEIRIKELQHDQSKQKVMKWDQLDNEECW